MTEVVWRRRKDRRCRGCWDSNPISGATLARTCERAAKVIQERADAEENRRGNLPLIRWEVTDDESFADGYVRGQDQQIQVLLCWSKALRTASAGGRRCCSALLRRCPDKPGASVGRQGGVVILCWPVCADRRRANLGVCHCSKSARHIRGLIRDGQARSWPTSHGA